MNLYLVDIKCQKIQNNFHILLKTPYQTFIPFVFYIAVISYVRNTLLQFLRFALHCLYIWPSCFGDCIVCPTSIYSFWLPPVVSSNLSPPYIRYHKLEPLFYIKRDNCCINVLLLFVCLFVWWCLTPLSTIFQLYRDS